MHFKKESLGKIAEGIVSYMKTCERKAGATVIALSGDLGAGKTALTQHIARVLGVAQIPPSPTFVIMRSYETTDTTFTKLVHIDAYRIETEDELRPLHLDAEFGNEGALVCIEWPEKIASAIPEGALHITLTTVNENERELKTEQKLQEALQKLVKVV